MSRGNATYLRDGTYNSPYYRIWLHCRNNNQQHRRLRQHCISKPNTYYVAPQFNSIEEFNARFLARQIVANCRIIPLTLCDDIADNGQHCITFQSGNPAWDFHSEPRRHEKSFTGEDLPVLYRGSFHQWQPINANFAAQLLDESREIAKQIIAQEESKEAERVRPLLDEAQVGREPRDLLLRTADILSATLGVTLVLVGSRE